MNFSKHDNHGSVQANGQRIRDLRYLLGLTQLELALKADCSERLIRKMEKYESVSTKSLWLLSVFFRTQNIEASVVDLIVLEPHPLKVARQWFRESFIDHSKLADQKWFCEEVVLSENTLSKLRMLERAAVAFGVTEDVTLHHEQNVAISFSVDCHDSPLRDPSGTVWLQIASGKINRLHVVLDSELEWDESKSIHALQHHQ